VQQALGMSRFGDERELGECEEAAEEIGAGALPARAGGVAFAARGLAVGMVHGGDY
jgi:hypothetical protein